MKKKKYINKTGVTLLSILLITSLTAIVALSVAVADCANVHNLQKQITKLQEELVDLQNEPKVTEPLVVEPQSTESIGPTEPIEPTEPEPVLTSMGRFKLTAYCPCEKCCGKWANKRPTDKNGNPIVYGATGARLEAGVSIAVDPKVIPYGSTVVINGHEYIAQDCGGGIKKNRIDIFFNNHQEALEFGVQTATVYMKGSGEGNA